MEEKTTETKQGFRRASVWLLGITWLGLVFAGMAIAFTPSPHSPAVGWVLLVLAAAIALVTMDRWVKIFPGLLAYGILGSVLSLMDGHAVNHPEVSVSRIGGVVMIVFFTIATLLSFTFTKRELQVTDRVALFAFVVAFFWQAVAPSFMWIVLGVGFCFLLFAWLYDHFQHRRGQGSRPESQVTAN